MKIRMLIEQSEGAILNGEPWPGVGEVADVPTAQAAHLVASGVAEDATADERPPRRRKAASPESEAT
ncbi:hypothetical protein G9272_16935 [Streptomyces asoensis]|uniref:Uncharacterized protein n=1 Tax=Streptomyces asoensis TaxID=249586 RepID=A0A6M4WR60_9ACTN|nr:hypothetical protein [Streptomyces asoensis]QJT01785.1 hypothetical protein G9272_16935 [Streptomyces asoensis]